MGSGGSSVACFCCCCCLSVLGPFVCCSPSLFSSFFSVGGGSSTWKIPIPQLNHLKIFLFKLFVHFILHCCAWHGKIHHTNTLSNSLKKLTLGLGFGLFMIGLTSASNADFSERTCDAVMGRSAWSGVDVTKPRFLSTDSCLSRIDFSTCKTVEY